MKNIGAHHLRVFQRGLYENIQLGKHIICSNSIWTSANPSQNSDISTSCLKTSVAKLSYLRRNRLEKPKNPDVEANLPTFKYASEKSKPKSRVYVWGCAQHGALGIKSLIFLKRNRFPVTFLQWPVLLPLIKEYDVVDIACGYGFSVFAVKAKGENKGYQVFGTGLNEDSQVGFHKLKRSAPLNILAYPLPINIPLQTAGDKIIKQVACGRAHTLILTDKSVYSLGNNAYGQCGRKIIENEDYKGNPTVHKIELEEEIEEIVCGQDNSIIRTKNGELYTCGWGADGQLGTGNYRNEWKFTKIGGDISGENIKQVSCAGDCVLAVSEKGDLYGWGNNEYNQVSREDIQQLPIPRHIPTPECGKITNVAAGGTMCAFINADGLVYVWGYGILGIGPAVLTTKTFTPILMTLFGKNDFNPNTTVKSIRCGLSHFAAITNDGNLYTWGKNKYGQLGLGTKNDQYFPLRVAVPSNVTEVFCGIDHTAVLCKTHI